MEAIYRRAQQADIAQMAKIRAEDWGPEQYWRERIEQYLNHQLNPKEALRPREAIVCEGAERIVGLVAGHLTVRFDCEGELEWISVDTQFRRRGIASKLLRSMAEWFVEHEARRICVDVQPSNEAARRFYRRHGAEDLNPHWMVWKDIGRAMEGWE